jgi:hypothetical protein
MMGNLDSQAATKVTSDAARDPGKPRAAAELVIHNVEIGVSGLIQSPSLIEISISESQSFPSLKSEGPSVPTT